MSRLVLAQHGDDTFCECGWSDGHGTHTRRCTEEMDEATLGHVKTILESNPDVVRWQIEHHGGSVMIGRSREGDTGPLHTGQLKQAAEVRRAAEKLMDWCDEYCAGWMTTNDTYELGRHIERLELHLADMKRIHEKRTRV